MDAGLHPRSARSGAFRAAGCARLLHRIALEAALTGELPVERLAPSEDPHSR